MISENKLILDMSDEEYAALPHLSASKLRALHLYPPRRAHQDLNKKKFEKNIPFGRLLHLFVLEPKIAESMLVAIDENTTKSDKNTVAAKRSELMAQGKYPVPNSTYLQLEHLRDLCHEHKECNNILQNSQKEATALWHDEDYEVDGKSKIDIISENTIFDLKTAAGGHNIKDFKRSIQRMAYLIQAYWYKRSLSMILNKEFNFGFIVVDPEYKIVRIHHLEQHDLELGKQQVELSIKTWKHCTKHKSWPKHFIFN